MRHLKNPTLILNTTRFLGMICLLLATAGLTFAQSDPAFSINDIVVNEGDSNLFGHEFTVRLSAPSNKATSVVVSTQQGTATDNVDFGAGSVTLNFQPGQTSQLVTVFITGDTVVEGTETFFLNLSNPVNATIADGQGLVTIIDDDTLLLLNQQGSSRGAALDSVFQTHESFPITTDLAFYRSADGRMRISVFAIGLKLADGETASAVTATAEDSVGTVRPLTVEFVGTVTNTNWLKQVTMKLNDQIPAGDVKIKISLHGVSSNTVLAAVTPQ